MRKVKLDEEIILIGEDYNLSVREDPETRQLHVGILSKNAELYESLYLTNKLDLKGDKSFQTFTLRAIGEKRRDYGAGGGEVKVKEPTVYTGQEAYDYQDRKLNKLNHNV